MFAFRFDYDRGMKYKANVMRYLQRNMHGLLLLSRLIYQSIYFTNFLLFLFFIIDNIYVPVFDEYPLETIGK